MMWEEKVTEIKEHDLLTGISPSFDTRVVFAQSNWEYICRTSGKMGFALDNFTSTKVALWSYGKITCISDTLYFYILAGYNLSG